MEAPSVQGTLPLLNVKVHEGHNYAIIKGSIYRYLSAYYLIPYAIARQICLFSCLFEEGKYTYTIFRGIVSRKRNDASALCLRTEQSLSDI